MIFCLIGKSASGKSTIEHLLQEKGLKRIISTTSRPPREREVNGVDYHYVTDEEFKTFDRNGEMLESTEYRGWHYGIRLSDIDLDENSVVAVEPCGFRQMKQKLGDKVVGIYLYINDKERLIRALNREINPDVDEIVRRFISDKELFKDIEKEVQYSFENWDSYKVVDEIMKIIPRKRTVQPTEPEYDPPMILGRDFEFEGR